MSHAQRMRRRRRGSGGPRNKAFLGLTVVGILVVLAGLGAVGLRRVDRRLGAAALLAQAEGDRRQHPRVRGRRARARLHPGRRAAPAAALGGHPAGRQGRDDRDRGRALLRAQGRRLRGRRARGVQEPRVAQDGPGRLDDHHAARPLALHLERAHVHAQDPRGEARRGARGRALQGVDPREVPRLDPVRHGRRPVRDRHQGRGEDLLLQGPQGPQPQPGRAARRPAAGAVGLLADAQQGRGQEAPQRGAATRWRSWA